MEQQRLSPSGVELVVDIAGVGDRGTVVLLHAGGESRAVYRPIAPALVEEGWRTLAPDLRGHGESGRADRYRLGDLCDDVHGLIEALAVGPVVLAGGSLGGVVALHVAARVGSRLCAVVLLDIVPSPRAEAGHRERDKIERARARGAAPVAGIDPTLAALVAEVMAERSRTREAAATLQVPVMLIHGRASHVIGEPELRAFASDLPHARIVAVDAGHLVARDQPAEVASAVKELLRTVGRGA